MRASGANAIFPDWNADPEKESSYNFGPSDRIIGAIVDSGATVYYRVGRSWGADPEPPADPAKFASIVKHVAMHYNARWAKGHRYDIRYWEIWNEPDMEANWFPGFAQPFWTGTPEQFYTLYERVARALKEFDPNLKVGACGKAAGNIPGPYREGLIRYCATRKVPLDFFSWHHYHDRSPDPWEMVRIGGQIRDILDAAGFTAAESHVTEWNMNLRMNNTGPLGQNSMNGAAFTAAALIYLQDSKVDRAFYYRGDIGAMGLFEPGGAYRKKAYAYKAAGAMLETPERLDVIGADARGFAVLAGRSTDGRKIRILLAHFAAPPAGEATAGDYKLSVDNLPWRDARFTVKRYRLDQESDLALVSEQAGEKNPGLTGKLPPPGVEFIVIERQ